MQSLQANNHKNAMLQALHRQCMATYSLATRLNKRSKDSHRTPHRNHTNLYYSNLRNEYEIIRIVHKILRS